MEPPAAISDRYVTRDVFGVTLRARWTRTVQGFLDSREVFPGTRMTRKMHSLERTLQRMLFHRDRVQVPPGVARSQVAAVAPQVHNDID